MNIIKMIFAAGAGQVVNNITTATTPANASKFVKVFTKIGAFAFGWMVGDLVGNAVDGAVNDFKRINGELEEE